MESSSSLNRRPPWLWALLLFALALALRLLFWQATPDAAWPYSAFYKGDATTWLAWARAIRQGLPFEAGLPIRPPGAAYLIASLGLGRPADIVTLKLVWCLLGAGVVPLLYLAVRSQIGPRPALTVGLICAASTGLMILSTSLNNETPYLFLVAIVLWLWEPLRRRPRAALLLAWSAAHATACLLRVEHVLFLALLSGCLLLTWAGQGSRRRWQPAVSRVSLSLLAWAALLAPWHAEAWADIRRFNSEPLRTDAASEAALRQVERAVAHVRWDEEARRRLEELPAGVRRNATAFIAATVAVRGGRQVTGNPLRILEEAFGSHPRPLPAHPFVALYGGLNFYLANNPDATGGFDRTPLEKAPPLAGGVDRYPRALVRGLPPPQLTLTYPPHLEILDRGYSLGGDWIRHHPGAYGRLALEKVRRFWRGATLGLGGYNLPLGLSGRRPPVDLVTPNAGKLSAAWRLALLALSGLGLWAGRRTEALVPWLAFLLSKLVITLAFFGYARHGATVIPVVALLVALALERVIDVPRRQGPAPGRGSRWPARAVLAGVVLLLATEATRWRQTPEVRVDGRIIGASDPFPAADHRDRRIEVR